MKSKAIEVADEALAAHTKHIGGMVNELGGLLEKLEASHEYEYQRGYREGCTRGYQEAIDRANLQLAHFGFKITVQSCP